jgi:thiol:disulfide interchange protein DsbG
MACVPWPQAVQRTAPDTLETLMKRRQFHLSLLAAAAGSTLLQACSDKPAEPAPTPPAAKPGGDEAYTLAAKGHGFTVGVPMAANTVYVFFDTTCPHCAELWDAARPLLGKIKMVWMPLGLLRPSSAPQGATILSAPDPSAAMTENEKSVQARGGGITAAANLSSEVLAKVKANTDLFGKLGADSVPLIVYRHAVTGNTGMHAGSMKTEDLARLLGV